MPSQVNLARLNKGGLNDHFLPHLKSTFYLPALCNILDMMACIYHMLLVLQKKRDTKVQGKNVPE